MTVFLFITVTLAGCVSGQRAGNADDKTALAAEFATYQEVPVNIQPAIKPYQVEPDLSNVTNREKFEFSPEAFKLLANNGFVVTPGQMPEFFMLYETNRYDNIPNFVTTDAMLHNYHLFFNHLLKSVENKYLIPELKALNSSMVQESLRQYEELKGSEWENAALRNLAFFTVGAMLLDPSAKIPAAVQDVVTRELALIDKHDGITVSPVMSIGYTELNILEDLKEDYTQYIPRGHYTKSEDLKRYFKSMMWYGRLTFRQKDVDETRSAVLMTLALNEGQNLNSWDKIYQSTNFFVGKSDDLGYYQYEPVLREVYGKGLTLKTLVKDAAKWEAFVNKIKELDPPAINSIPVFDESIQPDREHEIKGFRFMGQRFTLDAAIFQRLIYREVKENSQGQRRTLPKGLDIPAAMGSKEAYSLLDNMNETDYEGYPDNMQKLKGHVKGLKLSNWTENLYWNWLYTLLPLTWEKPEGYPSFMQNQAWQRKDLATYLGSWTELKHDTVLYAKQVYAEMGGGAEPEDDRGYVEPNPHLFARLAALCSMTSEGLASRGLLSDQDQDSLSRMETLALSLKDIAEKELNNTPLTDADYELIRTFGGQLEHFWLEALKDDDVVSRSQIWENPAALVTDVATAPPDTVLEEATGMVWSIYAVVPVDGKLRIARGAVYSYYEFPWPSNDRLTDSKWQEMLRNDEAPDPPDWIQSYTGKVENIPAW
jgi:hypothetical protein